MKRVLHYAAAEAVGGLLGQVALLAPRTGLHGWSSEVMISPHSSLDAYTSAMTRSGVGVRRLAVTGKLDLAGLFGLRRTLREIRPDILHVHLASPVESLPVLLAARARRPAGLTRGRDGSP